MECDARALLPDWDWEGACQVPYKVALDSGSRVLVHRDEHWLVRDLELQAEGPRQAADGMRCVKRIVERQNGELRELIDHVTRKVRPADGYA